MVNIKPLQTPSFGRAVKKLKKNQKTDLDKAIKYILDNPLAGDIKRGDLDYLRVYKFKMLNQPVLLGYEYVDGDITLMLIKVGSHENFYRDIKRN